MWVNLYSFANLLELSCCRVLWSVIGYDSFWDTMARENGFQIAKDVVQRSCCELGYFNVPGIIVHNNSQVVRFSPCKKLSGYLLPWSVRKWDCYELLCTLCSVFTTGSTFGNKVVDVISNTWPPYRLLSSLVIP